MPRINIEDSLFQDSRFLELVVKMGSQELALGCVVVAFKVAQKYWVDGRRPVPPEHFRRMKFHKSLLDVGLAVESDAGFYIKGSEEQFHWILQRTEAGRAGGIASGRARREITEKKSKRDEAGRSKVKQNEASYSSSYSSSFSKNKNTLHAASPLVPDGTACAPGSSGILFKLWNENRGSLPEAKAMNAERQRHSLARWKEKPDEEYWRTVVKKIAASKFCNGGGSTSWRADFEFLLRPGSHLKVMEGKYDDRAGRVNDVDWSKVFGDEWEGGKKP